MAYKRLLPQFYSILFAMSFCLFVVLASSFPLRETAFYCPSARLRIAHSYKPISLPHSEHYKGTTKTLCLWETIDGKNERRPDDQKQPYLKLFGRRRKASSSDRSKSSDATSVIDRPNVSSADKTPQARQSHGTKPANQKKSTARMVRSMFYTAKGLERKGRWRAASALLEKILEKDPHDAHTHLALARLEARREQKQRNAQISKNIKAQSIQNASMGDTVDGSFEINSSNSTWILKSKARTKFLEGTKNCPDSVHLWQAWAVYEESLGNTQRARELFQRALQLDQHNTYACHALGLMEKKLGNVTQAKKLFSQALEKNSTAALVCSMGELLIEEKELEKARDLYKHHLDRLTKEKDKMEVFLASAWLEERYFRDYERAQELIHLALTHSPGSSLAHVALARLEGRVQRRNSHSGFNSEKDATRRRLAAACINIEQGNTNASRPNDGRLFNAWANTEVRLRRFNSARKILRRGIDVYPDDHALLQAAGKVEERVGNYTGARRLYSQSLNLEPSAPTLVACAQLELRYPAVKPVDNEKVNGLFEEALLLDPRHGPAYNAYGNAEFQRGNIDAARTIFKRGVRAGCSDAASLYHGYGKLELSLGNVDVARDILMEGLSEVRRYNVGMDSPYRERARFLYHTLGMLELNSNHPTMAMDVFTEGITRYGNSSQLLLGAALCNIKLGREDPARLMLEQSVLHDSKHAQAWQAWGIMEARSGNFKTAETLFTCGVKSAPQHGALWHAYASMEQRRGNTETSRRLFAVGIKKAPRHTQLYQGWASLELRDSNYLLAKKLITEALTRDKRNGSAWIMAAEIERQLENRGLANLLLRRGIECAPNDAELYRTLGESLVATGKIEDAREVFEKGIEMNPVYAPLYHSLAELEARVCNLQGLANLNKRAAKMFNNNALVPPPSSSQAFGTKIRAKRTRNLPRGVAALAHKIVDDDGNESGGTINSIEEKTDPTTTLDTVVANLMVDDLLGDLLDVNSIPYGEGFPAAKNES